MVFNKLVHVLIQLFQVKLTGGVYSIDGSRCKVDTVCKSLPIDITEKVRKDYSCILH